MKENRELGWENPPNVLDLKPDDVHIWLASQNQEPTEVDSFWNSLSSEEKERAERFHFIKDRHRYIVSHGILRFILGMYLGVDPAYVGYQIGAYGKPSLTDEFCSCRIRFNLSHSGDAVLLGFTRGRELGVDIEKIRTDFATIEIARAYFSPQEILTFQSLPKRLQTEAFYNCWTRKEAFIKAIGEGVSCPLNMFDVTLAPGEPAKLLATRLKGNPVSKWSLVGLNSGHAYKAAMVTESGNWNLKCWKWTDRTTGQVTLPR
jgi:4'-phosphopantetheinyl transferase